MPSSDLLFYGVGEASVITVSVTSPILATYFTDVNQRFALPTGGCVHADGSKQEDTNKDGPKTLRPGALASRPA